MRRASESWNPMLGDEEQLLSSASTNKCFATTKLHGAKNVLVLEKKETFQFIYVPLPAESDCCLKAQPDDARKTSSSPPPPSFLPSFFLIQTLFG